jgi:DNA-binding response OmpR family regulator
MNLRDQYVEAIEAENDQLREKIRMLEEAMGLRIEAPLVFQLTRHEAMMFGILFKRELVTKQLAMDALYGDRIDIEPEIKIIDVFVCKLRKKLKRFDIEVETVWGQGYRMPAQSKALAAALLEQSRAT